MNAIVKNAKDNIPLISVIVILLGYFNIYHYFQFFGLNIYNYLDISEIIFSFSSIFFSALTFSVSLFAGSLIIHYSQLPRPVFTDEGVSENLKQSIEYATTDLKKTTLYTTIFVVIFMTISIVPIVISLRTEIEELYLLFLWFNVCACFFLVSKLYISSKRLNALRKRVISKEKTQGKFDHEEYNRINQSYMVGFATITFIILLLYRNLIMYKNITEGCPKYEIEFIHQSKSIKSSNMQPYIGSTKGYIFLYNISKKETLIYPEREVSVSKIRRLRSGM